MQKCYYTTSGLIASADGFQDNVFYRGNNIFGPDPTTLDHSLGSGLFPEYYGKYVCLASKIRATFVNGMPGADPADVQPVSLVLYPVPASHGTVTGMNQIAAQPFAQRKEIQQSTGDRSTAFFKSYMTTAKVFQVAKRQIMDNADYAGTRMTGPLNSWIWQFYIGAMNEANLRFGGYLSVKIVYYVMWIHRNNPESFE